MMKLPHDRRYMKDNERDTLGFLNVSLCHEHILKYKKPCLCHIPILVEDHKDIGNEHDGVESQDVGYQDGDT